MSRIVVDLASVLVRLAVVALVVVRAAADS